MTRSTKGRAVFFAEVRRLKCVVDSVDLLCGTTGEAVLFLLDEVLHGTNSRERNIGAKAVVQHMIASGGVGAVSSHDLGLVELEKLTEGRIVNRHFEDHIVDGKMAFDFRMKPGPVGSSNALRLMRAVGIDVPGLVDSERAVSPDKANPDKAKPDKAKPDKANPDKANPDKANPDEATATKPA